MSTWGEPEKGLRAHARRATCRSWCITMSAATPAAMEAPGLAWHHCSTASMLLATVGGTPRPLRTPRSPTQPRPPAERATPTPKTGASTCIARRQSADPAHCKGALAASEAGPARLWCRRPAPRHAWRVPVASRPRGAAQRGAASCRATTLAEPLRRAPVAGLGLKRWLCYLTPSSACNSSACSRRIWRRSSPVSCPPLFRRSRNTPGSRVCRMQCCKMPTCSSAWRMTSAAAASFELRGEGASAVGECGRPAPPLPPPPPPLPGPENACIRTSLHRGGRSGAAWKVPALSKKLHLSPASPTAQLRNRVVPARRAF